MNSKDLHRLQHIAETDAAIAEAEAEYERTGKLYDAHETLAFLRENCFSK